MSASLVLRSIPMESGPDKYNAQPLAETGCLLVEVGDEY